MNELPRSKLTRYRKPSICHSGLSGIGCLPFPNTDSRRALLAGMTEYGKAEASFEELDP